MTDEAAVTTIDCYRGPGVRLYVGDVGTVLPVLAAESPAVVLTDPPYFYWAQVCASEEAQKLELSSEAIWMADMLVLTLSWMPMLRHLRPGIALFFGEPNYCAMYMRVARLLKWPMVACWISLRTEGREEYLMAFADDWDAPHLAVERQLLADEVPHALRLNSYGQGKSAEMLQDIISVCPWGPVLDPFCGSGTTLLAALREGREAVGIESDRSIASAAARMLLGEDSLLRTEV